MLSNKVFAEIKDFLRMDRDVTKAREEEGRKALVVLAGLIALGFLIMCIPNIVQKSYIMLATTAGAAVLFLIGMILALVVNKAAPVKIAIYIVLIVVFPTYTYFGGNDGFACLWIIIVSYLVMYYVDLKVGFLIDLFYFVMLVVLFWVGVPGFHAEQYNETFLIRFPVFYGINLIFAMVLVVNVKKYQYKMILTQKKYEDLSIRDLNTNIFNRNGYIEYTKKFNYAVDSLGYVYIDANELHKVNNLRGHEEGDRFLRAIADGCKVNFPTEHIFRLGGDEFLVICENIAEQDLVDRMEAMDKELWDQGWICAYGYEYRSSGFNLDQMLRLSNQRMLDDKATYYSTPEHNRRKKEKNTIMFA